MKTWEELREALEQCNRAVHQGDRHGQHALLTSEGTKQHLTLLTGTHGLPRSTNGKNLVAFLRIRDAVGDEPSQIRLADRFTAGKCSAAEHHIGPPFAATFHLSAQAFKKSCGADDGVTHLAIGLQCFFEGQLGFLEFQKWLLHTNGREENVMGNPSLPTFGVGVQGGLVVNRPRVLSPSSSRGEAAHDHINRLRESVSAQ